MKSYTFAVLCIFPCTLSESLDEVSMLQLNSNAEENTGGKMSTVDPWLSKCKLKTYFRDGPKVTSEKDEEVWDDGKHGVPASSMEHCNDMCNAVKDCTCFIMDTTLNRCNLKKDCQANFGFIKTANWAAHLTSCYREVPPKTPCSGKTAGQECQGLRFKGKCTNFGGVLKCDGPCAGLDTGVGCEVGGGQGICISDGSGNRVCKVNPPTGPCDGLKGGDACTVAGGPGKCVQGATGFECKPVVVKHDTFSLWRANRECHGWDTDLGEHDTVDDCRKACIVKGGSRCNFFIFGTFLWKKNKCFWKASDSCVDENFELDAYDIYKRDTFKVREYDVWQVGKECASGLFQGMKDEHLGKHFRATDCQQACIAAGGDGCNYFRYGRNWLDLLGGECYWQHTDECQTGQFKATDFTVYKLKGLLDNLPATGTFSLYAKDRECQDFTKLLGIWSTEINLGGVSSPEDCFEKCIAKGKASCNFVAYEPNPLLGFPHACKWESTDACVANNLQTPPLIGAHFDLYKRDSFKEPKFELWKEGKHCQGFEFEDIRLGVLGHTWTSDDCRSECLKRGGAACNFYIWEPYGKTWGYDVVKPMPCWWEHTDSCNSGVFSNSKYNLYRRVQ